MSIADPGSAGPERLVWAAGVGYSYGSRRALRGVELEVRAGEIVGIVGPNGSGKTTLLKLLAGFLRPTQGALSVLGHDPLRDGPGVFRDVRFAFAPPALFERLSAREHLHYLARIGGRGHRAPSESEVEQTLRSVGLADRAEERVEGFSFGMRQRLVLAQALLPRPRLLVLDEPSDGLDPLAVLELRAMLLRLREEFGLAVLLSSHLMLEVEELVDGLLVLHEGQALFHGRPAELFAGRSRTRLRVDDHDLARERLKARGCVLEKRPEGELEVVEGELTLREASDLLQGAGLSSFRVHRPRLEDVLLEMLKRGSVS